MSTVIRNVIIELKMKHQNLLNWPTKSVEYIDFQTFVILADICKKSSIVAKLGFSICVLNYVI